MFQIKPNTHFMFSHFWSENWDVVRDNVEKFDGIGEATDDYITECMPI
jgi:hypothetical protein